MLQLDYFRRPRGLIEVLRVAICNVVIHLELVDVLHPLQTPLNFLPTMHFQKHITVEFVRCLSDLRSQVQSNIEVQTALIELLDF